MLPHVIAEEYDKDPVTFQFAMFGEERYYDKHNHAWIKEGLNG